MYGQRQKQGSQTDRQTDRTDRQTDRCLTSGCSVSPHSSCQPDSEQQSWRYVSYPLEDKDLHVTSTFVTSTFHRLVVTKIFTNYRRNKANICISFESHFNSFSVFRRTHVFIRLDHFCFQEPSKYCVLNIFILTQNWPTRWIDNLIYRSFTRDLGRRGLSSPRGCC